MGTRSHEKLVLPSVPSRRPADCGTRGSRQRPQRQEAVISRRTRRREPAPIAIVGDQAAQTSSCDCSPVRKRGVDQAAAYVSPCFGVPIADDDHVGKDTEAAQRPTQSNRLCRCVLHLWLHDEEIQIAPPPRITSGMRPEQDHLRAGRRSQQSLPCLIDDRLAEHTDTVALPQDPKRPWASRGA
jgi:hypothetical protein